MLSREFVVLIKNWKVTVFWMRHIFPFDPRRKEFYWGLCDQRLLRLVSDNNWKAKSAIYSAGTWRHTDVDVMLWRQYDVMCSLGICRNVLLVLIYCCMYMYFLNNCFIAIYIKVLPIYSRAVAIFLCSYLFEIVCTLFLSCQIILLRVSMAVNNLNSRHFRLKATFMIIFC